MNILYSRIFRFSRRKVTLSLLVLLPLGVILQIWVSNRLTTFGQEINQIERLRSQLVLENQLLENEIAERSSLKLMKVYATNLGFVSARNIEYLTPNP